MSFSFFLNQNKNAQKGKYRNDNKQQAASKKTMSVNLNNNSNRNSNSDQAEDEGSDEEMAQQMEPQGHQALDSMSYLELDESSTGILPCMAPSTNTFTVIVILHRDTVALPGQTIPLRESSRSIISLLERVLSNPTQMFLGLAYDPSFTGNFRFGTLMEIRRAQRGDDAHVLVTCGTQRFEVLRDLDYDSTTDRPMRRVVRAEARLVQEAVVPMDAVLRKQPCWRAFGSMRSVSKVPWLSRWLDVTQLKQRALALLVENLRWGNEGDGSASDNNRNKFAPLLSLPASDFSYQLMSQLPLTLSQQAALFNCSNVNTRLLRLIEALELQLKEGRVRCKTCGLNIAAKHDLIQIMSEGNLGTFVNAHGFIHQIVTVSNVTHCQLVTRPTLDNTWFDGKSKASDSWLDSWLD